MQSKSQKKTKNYFKYWYKETLTLFVFLAFLGIIVGQTSNNQKNKTSKYKDSVAKSTFAIAKIEKMLAVDTVKKTTSLFNQQEVIIDSLFIGTGNFKFYKKNAHASYYADKFHNRKTASGKKYDKNKFSAAHKKLPFGTIVRVTNEANGKSVIIEINDRGPFVKSREIDLSKRSFMAITGNKSAGNMKVTLELLQK